MSYSISASRINSPGGSGRRSLGTFVGAAWSRVTAISGANYGSILSLLVFLAIWEAAVRSGLLPAVLVPPPSSVVPSFLREQSNGMWLHNVLASLRHYAMGVAAGSILGIALGVASGLWPAVQKSQEGVARLLRPIPPIAWIPFAIIWFGVTEMAAAFIIGIGVFWFNYFAAYAAVRSVDKGYVELAYAFQQGGFFNRLTKIILPGAALGIFSGLRAGLGMGWVTVLAAELFGIPGIGQRMMEAAGLLATDIVVLYMVTIALLYTICDVAVTSISASVLRWQE
jgi:ABC-type nitrate/sulfonate/bicarbonate transport system permease component